MHHFLDRLTTAQKLILIGVLFILALGLPAWMTVQADLSVINVANTERAGLQPSMTVLKMIRQTQDVRKQLPGADARVQQQSLQKDLHSALQPLQQYASETGDAQLVERIGGLGKTIQALDAPAPPLTGLIGQQLELIEAIFDASTMALDPDADSFNLIMGTLLAGPNLTESLSQLQRIANQVAKDGRESANDRQQLVRALGLARLHERNTHAFMSKAIAARPESEPVLQPVVSAARQQADLALDMVEQQWLSSTTPSDPGKIASALEQAIQA